MTTLEGLNQDFQDVLLALAENKLAAGRPKDLADAARLAKQRSR